MTSTTTASPSTLSSTLLTTLRGAADSAQAARMQRYMKSEMPYLGIKTPALRALTRPLIRAQIPRDAAHYAAIIQELWDDATYREERYTALDYARHHHAFIQPEQL